MDWDEEWWRGGSWRPEGLPLDSIKDRPFTGGDFEEEGFFAADDGEGFVEALVLAIFEMV